MQGPSECEKQAQLPKNSIFSHVTVAVQDPIMEIHLACRKDSFEGKVDLVVGAYRDELGKPYVFKSVKDAYNSELTSNQNYFKEYLPMEGMASFCQGAKNLILGEDSPAIKQNRVVTCQSLSGTGALMLGFQFIKAFMPVNIYVSNPTWGNHITIIKDCGLKHIEYPYYNPNTYKLNIEGMLKFLQEGVEGSIVVLQACAHNPTGVDPTKEEWMEIGKVMKQKKMIPFFDSAYQGFASGDLEKDAWAIRYFAEAGFEMFIAQSLAKNMGLYGERIGAIHVVAASSELKNQVMSQLNLIVRKKYLSPPIHGALIANIILSDKALYENWKAELRDVVAARIIKMRLLLREKLEKVEKTRNWSHITEQIGMFSYTGLSRKQCEILADKYHVYALNTGRISISGINEANVDYLAESIKNAILDAA